MTENEQKLINVLRESDNPRALEIAIITLIAFLYDSNLTMAKLCEIIKEADLDAVKAYITAA